MYELLLQLSIGFTIALSGVVLPGPLLAYVSMKTLDSGPTTGTLAAIGHIMVELGILALAGFGLGALIMNPRFKHLIGSISGVLLLILSVSILRQSRNPQSSSEDITGGGHHPLLGGMLFSTIFNPTVAVWWMSLGLATLIGAINEAGLIGGAFWLIGHFSADLIWFSTVSFSVDRGRDIIGGPFYKGLLIACGAILIIFGVYFSIENIPELLL